LDVHMFVRYAFIVKSACAVRLPEMDLDQMTPRTLWSNHKINSLVRVRKPRLLVTLVGRAKPKRGGDRARHGTWTT